MLYYFQTTSIFIFQFGFCVLLPLLISCCFSGGDVIKSFPRIWRKLFTYVKLSSVVYGATACTTMSLQYKGVTYVTKVVFKNAKLIPTMIVGGVMDTRAEQARKVVKKRKYGVWEYTSALLLCVCAAGFFISPKHSKGGDDETKIEEESRIDLGGRWIGISLLAFSVIYDALVPNLHSSKYCMEH